MEAPITFTINVRQEDFVALCLAIFTLRANARRGFPITLNEIENVVAAFDCMLGVPDEAPLIGPVEEPFKTMEPTHA